MTIDLNDIRLIPEVQELPIEETDDLYTFLLAKEEDHSLDVKLLKSGQYIFISLIYKEREFSIEHMEFYMEETKAEILAEFVFQLMRLKSNKTRVIEKINWLKKKKILVEINENGSWSVYGYFGGEVKPYVVRPGQAK